MEPTPSTETPGTPTRPEGHPSGASDELASQLEAHAGRLLSYVERHFPVVLQPAHQPMDVLQDVYFEAFRRLGEFVPEGDDASYRWLVTIARHRMCQLLRRR